MRSPQISEGTKTLSRSPWRDNPPARHLARDMASSERNLVAFARHICGDAMPRTYYLRRYRGQARRAPRRMHQVRPQGPLSRPQANREIRAQGQPNEMARDAKRGLPEAGYYGAS